jgi:Antitoxin VbhA
VINDCRPQIVADAIGSVRAEGLEPGATVVEILDRWVGGAIDTEQLGEAARCLAAGEPVTHLLGPADPEQTRRSVR